MNEKMITNLTAFGLTRQEAVIYLDLLTKGAQTGYEVSKNTGISRSNTYASLAGLVDKGAAMVMESTASAYVPVKPEEFTENVLHALREKQKYILDHKPEQIMEPEGYITIQGTSHVMDRIRNMFSNARLRAYAVMSSELVDRFQDELTAMAERGCKVVILTDADRTLPGCTVYRFQKHEDQVHVVVDTKQALTGEYLPDDDNATFLYSCNRNLVRILREMLRDQIVILEKQNHVQHSVLEAMTDVL